MIIYIITIVMCSIIAFVRSKIESYYFYPVVEDNDGNVLESVIGNHRAILKTQNHHILDDSVTVNDNSKDKNPKHVMLIAHGNGGNIYHRDELIKSIAEIYDGDVFCFEYPGYGACKGDVSIKSCISECLWWIRQLATQYDRIDLYGESIGGGVIMQTVKDLPANLHAKIGTLYLQSTFSSIYHMVKGMNKPLSLLYKLLWKNDLDTLSVLKSDVCRNKKLVFIHSPEDEIVPFEQGFENYMQCRSNNKVFYETTGSHNYTQLDREMFNS